MKEYIGKRHFNSPVLGNVIPNKPVKNCEGNEQLLGSLEKAGYVEVRSTKPEPAKAEKKTKPEPKAKKATK